MPEEEVRKEEDGEDQRLPPLGLRFPKAQWEENRKPKHHQPESHTAGCAFSLPDVNADFSFLSPVSKHLRELPHGLHQALIGRPTQE